MELLQHRIVKHEPNEYGRKNIDVFITNGDQDLAIMTLYLEQSSRDNFKPLDKINISNVQKYDKILKRCFREYMKILVSKTVEIFGRKLPRSTEISLFTSPDPDWKKDLKESFSIQELKDLYNISGFKNYDPKNSLFMVSTMKNLEEVLYGKVMRNNPYSTPSSSIDYGSPEAPKKSGKRDVVISEPIHLKYNKTAPRYMGQTVSSRGKRQQKAHRGGKTRRKSKSSTFPISNLRFRRYLE